MTYNKFFERNANTDNYFNYITNVYANDLAELHNNDSNLNVNDKCYVTYNKKEIRLSEPTPENIIYSKSTNLWNSLTAYLSKYVSESGITEDKELI